MVLVKKNRTRALLSGAHGFCCTRNGRSALFLGGVGIGGRAAMVASTVETTSSGSINGVVEAALLETFNFGSDAHRGLDAVP
jgi:hypothetical protein